MFSLNACSMKISSKRKTLSEFTKYDASDCDEENIYQEKQRKDAPIEMTGFHNPALIEVVSAITVVIIISS